MIEWLAGMKGQPYGAKSQAMKEALRRGIGNPGTTDTPALDLAEIRRIVEAAVADVLAHYTLVSAPNVSESNEEEEIEVLLDTLSSTLVLQE